MAERWWPAGIAERRPIAALLVAFYAAPPDGWDGTLPRIAVSLPLAAAVAARGAAGAARSRCRRA